MGYWQLSCRTIATAQKLTVTSRSTLRGLELTVHLGVSTHVWEGSQSRIDIVPQFADLDVQFAGSGIALGNWRSSSTTPITLTSHGWEGTASFAAEVTPAELRRLELLRSGGPITIHGRFWADVYTDGRREQVPSCLHYTAALDRDAWLQLLRGAGLFESIAIEVPLHEPLPPDLEEAQKHIELANDARMRGGRGHIDAVAECRKALDALDQAGFGGNAPSDVIAFLKKQAGALTLAERVGVLQAALKLYCAPAHHAGSGADAMTHLDSAGVLAATAFVVQASARDRLGRGSK
jgi:hypothetical protein